MAHGRHRRAKISGRSPDARSLKIRKELQSDKRADRDPLHQADTETDARFSLMACEHPGTCSCESDYPNWSPGQR